MRPHLRIERRHPSGWTLAQGPITLGWIDAGRLVLHGFPDAVSAAMAAEAASRVLTQWHQQRGSEAGDATVDLLEDAHGFTCSLPDIAWFALLLELAQRLHVATLFLRNPQPEPAA